MADITTNSPRASSASPRATQLRTFLVADIRGYTAFSERRGDDAAARLTTVFADLAREVIGAHGGSVEGTRGDEVQASFTSARAALQAAVALQERYARKMVADPSLELHTGMGLAAGEVMEAHGGYAGRAVTLAARLCDMAAAGEVLASDGLLHLAGKTEGLEYIELQEMQLQGFSDPVRISRVVAEGQASPASGPLPQAEGLRIRLLGGFHVAAGSREIDESEWRLKKAATVIKLLALSQFHRVHREQAIDLLWPELEPSAAANNLHHALHVARRILEPSGQPVSSSGQPVSSSGHPVPGHGDTSRAIRLRNELITLEWPDGVWVDVTAFEEAAAQARQTGEPAQYRGAVELYTGDLLPEDLYEDWAADRREALRALYHGLLIELAALYEARGEHAPAIDTLQRAVASDATMEDAHVALMRLYALTGQRQAALRQYEQLRSALQTELGVEPDETSQKLYREILSGDVQAGASALPPEPFFPDDDLGRPDIEPALPTHNLPVSLTSFIGRDREQRYVGGLLDSTRLLTLTGPGGAGKTRLAIAVARDVLLQYADGVRIVELAVLTDPLLVPQAVADVLEVREAQSGSGMVDATIDALRGQHMLLILDNCEHLIEACASLAETLLSACPRLQVMATSREALGVHGEVTWLVPPLTVPDPDEISLEQLEAAESVQLFVDRARQRQPSFALTEANYRAVAEIAKRLDGLPLAIELAAARVGVLSPEGIAARLEDALSLLTGTRRTSLPHQGTLRATLDWSYDLLEDVEKVLFNRLSVFAGGWTLEAAETVGAGGEVRADAMIDLLSRLLDKSLILTGVMDDSIGLEPAGRSLEPAGRSLKPAGRRYRMLGPIRQYGAEQLESSGEADTLHHRHAILLLSLAEQAEAELKGPRQGEWLEHLDAEIDNIRAALSWSFQRDRPPAGSRTVSYRAERLEIGLRMASFLWQFWHSRGHIGEGRSWLQRGLDIPEEAPAAVRAKALSNAGWHAHQQNDLETAIAQEQESLRLYRTLGDRHGEADALERLGDITINLDDHKKAREYHEEGLSIRREIDDRWGISKSLSSIFIFHLLGGDEAVALAMLNEALEIGRELGDQRGIAVTSHNIGMVYIESGRFDRAFTPIAESLRIFYRQKDKRDCSFCLEALGRIAGAQGNQPARFKLRLRAARLFGAASALRADVDDRLTKDRAEWIEGAVAAVRPDADVRAWDAAWEEGRRMPLSRIVEYALSPDDAGRGSDAPPSRAATVPTNGKASPLSPRELEVAKLIAEGLTNRQIAGRLVIAERTVDTHVGKILSKLELASRAQVAAWITEQGRAS